MNTIIVQCEGPPVAACLFCNVALPLAIIHYRVDRSLSGPIVALLPICPQCDEEHQKPTHPMRRKSDGVVTGTADRR